MSKLRISDFDNSTKGRISMRLEADDLDDELWFELPGGLCPHTDLIACAVACIFGSFYQEYEFLHPVTAVTRLRLEKATGSRWNAPEADGREPVGGNNIALNFSGGFDSLAALALLENRAKLVSLDFGQKFEREKEFYTKFESEVVATNARRFEKSWTFMAVGSILLREYLGADYISFGSILEASPWNFVRRHGGMPTPLLFQAAGYSSVNPVLGLSEFGTALVAAKAFPDHIGASLVSLAEPHTEKYLRKVMLIDVIKERFGLDIKFPTQLPEVTQSIEYGSSFAADFLAPGFLAFCDESDFGRWMSGPKGFRQTYEALRGDFYWRDCTESSNDVPAEIGALIAGQKNKYGIQPYRARDWDEFREVVKVMSLFHSFPGKTF